MATYTFEKTARLSRLLAEIKAQLSSVQRVDKNGTYIEVVFPSSLSTQDETTLSSIVVAHNATTAEDQISPIIGNAAEYGLKIIRDFGTRNMALNKSDQDIDSILENTEVLKIGMALISGSLKYARRKVSALTPFAGVTQSDKDWMYSQLTAFLGPE